MPAIGNFSKNDMSGEFIRRMVGIKFMKKGNLVNLGI